MRMMIASESSNRRKRQGFRFIGRRKYRISNFQFSSASSPIHRLTDSPSYSSPCPLPSALCLFTDSPSYSSPCPLPSALCLFPDSLIHRLILPHALCPMLSASSPADAAAPCSQCAKHFLLCKTFPSFPPSAIPIPLTTPGTGFA